MLFFNLLFARFVLFFKVFCSHIVPFFKILCLNIGEKIPWLSLGAFWLQSLYLQAKRILYISSWVSFLQQPGEIFVEPAAARKFVYAGIPSSAKVVGSPISRIKSASAWIPARAVSSSLSIGAMPHTFRAKRAKCNSHAQHRLLARHLISENAGLPLSCAD